MSRFLKASLLALLVTALIWCNCKGLPSLPDLKVVGSTVVYPPVDSFEHHEYVDPELASISQQQMKPTLTRPTNELSDTTDITVNDHRFDQCGEILVRDPVTEGSQFEQPLGLMCRHQYRRAILVPPMPNFTERGFKQCV